MIDLVVVVQASVAGLILFRASHETRRWDRAGFALLACSSGLMMFRRVTASLDRYSHADRVLLPHLITWVMLASATCFVLELLTRRMLENEQRPLRVASAKFFWPFALMLLVSATDLAAPPKVWSGENIRELTAEEALREALEGTNPTAAFEAVRRWSARGIDVLRIAAAHEGVEGAAALQKLRSISLRVNEAIAAHEDSVHPVVPPAATEAPK